MSKLRPCPFCGGRASTHYVSAESMLMAEMGRLSVPPIIRCESCGAVVSFDDRRHRGMTIEGASDMWNRRANECDREELLEIADYIAESDVDGVIDRPMRIREACGVKEGR